MPLTLLLLGRCRCHSVLFPFSTSIRHEFSLFNALWILIFIIFIRLRSCALREIFFFFAVFRFDHDSKRAEKWKSHEATTLQTIDDNLLDEMKSPGVGAQSDRA